MIGMALHNYHDAYRSFPPLAVYDAQGRPLLSWRVLILPFLQETELFNQFRLDEPWDSQHNRPLADRMPALFRCPSDKSPKPNASSYVAVSGEGTMFPHRRVVNIRDVKDGTSMTAVVGEIRHSAVLWTKPDDALLDDRFVAPGPFGSAHEHRWQFLMGDGTARFVRATTDPKVIHGLMTIAGGEPIDEDDF
jgi:hypothetical protein